MGIIANIVLLMLSSVVLFIGIEFYTTNKLTSNQTKNYVLGYSVFSAIWCSCYGGIGLTCDFEVAATLRAVGVFAINGFIITEASLLSGMSGVNKKARITSRITIMILAVIDTLSFAQKDVDIFVREKNWTTWYGNPDLDGIRTMHSAIVLLTMTIMFVLGVIWFKNARLRRQRKFISLVFVANFIMAFFTIPDTIMPYLGMYAISTSGMGAALCTIVIWYGASELNSFDINVGNVVDNIYKFIDAGVLVFDIDYNLAIANPYGQKLIPEGVKEHAKISDIFVMDNDASGRFFTDAIDSMVTARFKAVLDDRFFSVKNSVALDNNGEPYCYICACVDVTDEINMVNELAAANEAKTKFLTSISHEIRTPINAVLGFNEMISDLSDNPEILSCTANITRAGDLLLSIINDLLDMSKISSGNLDIVPEKYELATVLQNVYTLHSAKAEEKGLSFSLSNNESIPNVLIGDSVRLQQIINNLLSNAIKYTKAGRVKLKVDYTENGNNSINLCLSISDTGIGIRKEDMPYLFDSFTRFDNINNKHIEGTGVGLSITRTLVEKMGGTISVSSEYGLGTCFKVTIPQTVVSNEIIGKIDTANSTAVPALTSEITFTAPGTHVLVVDDNPMNLMVFEGLVKPFQINVDSTTEAVKMLDMIKQKKYDVLFLDHMMPGMDGIEAMHRLRQDKEHINQNTPVIVMTANCIQGAKEEYLKEGFDDYVGKPVKRADLAEILKKYLR